MSAYPQDNPILSACSRKCFMCAGDPWLGCWNPHSHKSTYNSDSPKTQLLIAHCWLEALTITNNRLTPILHVMCIAYCILTLKGAKENVITRAIQGSTVPTVLPISLKKNCTLRLILNKINNFNYFIKDILKWNWKKCNCKYTAMKTNSLVPRP